MVSMTALFLKDKNMQCKMKIADILIHIDCPFELHEDHSSEPFTVLPGEMQQKADLSLLLRPVDSLPEIPEILYNEPRRLFTGTGADAAVFFSSFPGNAPYAHVSHGTLPQGELICQYIPGNEKYMNYAGNLVTLMGFETVMLHFNALVLHSSFIRWHNSGILFSAPSGTGKSTQADLWNTYEGAEILNGDRAGLRRKNGIWHAYGLPIAGTSGIYRNECAPLKAIAVLRQASENSIRRLSAAEAFRGLYSEVLIHRWDPQFEAAASDLLLQIIDETPVFLLSCRPDRDAADLFRSEIEKL